MCWSVKIIDHIDQELMVGVNKDASKKVLFDF